MIKVEAFYGKKKRPNLVINERFSNLAPLNYYKVDSLCKNKEKYPFNYFLLLQKKKSPSPFTIEFRVLIFQFDLIVFINTCHALY
jgi:hypothetical protein